MIIDLPSGRQTFDFDCGAKALQLVLAYYGIDVREDRLMEELSCDKYGTLAKNMAAFAEENGFQVLARCGVDLATVKQYIEEKRPVIVLVQAWADRYMTLKDWEEANEYGHYVIVIGHQDDIIIFADPSSFPRTWMTEEEFLARWHYTDARTRERLDHFAMVFFGKEPVQTRRLEHMD